MTWIYKQTEVSPDLFTVGFYDPDGKFQSESDHCSREDAVKRIRYLNGGEMPHEKEWTGTVNHAKTWDQYIDIEE